MQPDLENFENQTKNNEAVFKGLIQKMRPDIFALITVMDEEGVNYAVIFHMIHALIKLATGTGYGKVILELENGVVTFIDGIERKRINEAAILQKNSAT